MDIIDQYDIHPGLMFNYDETYIEAGDMKNIKVLTPAGSVPLSAVKSDSMHTSFGVTVSADCTYLSHFVVSQRRHVDFPEVQPETAEDFYICCNEEGAVAGSQYLE